MNTDISSKIIGINNPEMDFQLVRQLAASVYRGASIGECFTIANSLQHCGIDEWVCKFKLLAEWQKKDGMERLVKNHVVSGREQLFRASNSFRAAEYYSPITQDEYQQLGQNSADCFCMAVSGMDVHFENHSIPYNDISLPAYFISPANDGAKRKTIMLVSDFDGTMEEEFLMRGIAGIQRNYNIILFAGPGSIDVARKYAQSSYAPDFELIVKRIINHFEFRHEVDKNHLCLMGSGSGAFFAIRAACYEPRIKSLILNSPVLNLDNYLRTVLSQNLVHLAHHDLTLKELYAMPDDQVSPPQKAQLQHCIGRLGKPSLKISLAYLSEFKIGPDLENITQSCLALIGDHDEEELQDQCREFCEKIDAQHYRFTDFEGAGSHCQIGNASFANAVTYDWLDSL